MKRRTVLTFLTAGVLAQAEAVAEPSEPLMAGVQALKAAPNYAWTITTEMPGAPFKVASMRGRADADGWLVLETEVGGRRRMVVGRREGRVFNEAGVWRSPAEAERLKGDENTAAQDLMGAPTPTGELAALLPKLGGLRREADGSYYGALPEVSAKGLILAVMKGRAPGGFSPELKAPVGNLRLWLQDGRPQRYVISATATASLPFATKEIKRISTVEISEVGSTRVEVPVAARTKLEDLLGKPRTTDRRPALPSDVGLADTARRND
jgi:hypothetical protein